MEKFPELKNDQVALLRADINTGIVLDEQYNYAINQKQKVYTIFNSVNEALQFAKLIMLENSRIECGLYGKDEKILYNLTPSNIESY